MAGLRFFISRFLLDTVVPPHALGFEVRKENSKANKNNKKHKLSPG
jgi:hypothetical protein